MSANYGGRRSGQVNFSTFIEDLNVEVPSQDSSPRGEEWEKEMAMFTNTNFFDWEKAAGAPNFPGPPVSAREPEKKKPAVPREPVAAVVPAVAPAAAPAAASAVGDFDFGIAG